MRRIAFVVLLLYVVWRVLKVWTSVVLKKSRGAEDYSRFSPRNRQRKNTAEGAAELGCCSVCGTHVPTERLVGTGSGEFCCSEDCLRILRSREKEADSGTRT